MREKKHRKKKDNQEIARSSYENLRGKISNILVIRKYFVIKKNVLVHILIKMFK